MKKKIFALALALTLSLSLAACGSSSGSAASSGAASGSAASSTPAEPVVLNVAASPTPHAEILAQVKDVLAEQGIDLQIHEYGDYVVPNTAVEEGDEDVNYFQHQPYLDQFNEENGTHLVSVAAIHYEPFGIYPCKTASLEELPDGATVAVPNDATNEARALQLLAAQGLIEIDPNVTSEVDIAAINGNYALQAGFSSANDAIALEDPDSEAAQTFANIIVVKEGNENNPAVQALVKALQSDAVRDYINETYNNNVLPVF